MQLKQRINFNMFPETKTETVSGGLMSEQLKEAMSQDLALKSVIKLIAKNSIIYWVSAGKWSMHEMLLDLLNITGPARVHISSYAMCETAPRTLAQLKNTKMITELYCLLDNRIDVRSAGAFQLIKSISDKCVLVDTHAKVTCIENDAWRLAVIGSANYTENKRYEAGIITVYDSGVTCKSNGLKKDYKMEWNEETLNAITKIAAAAYTPRQTAFALGITPKEFIEIMRDDEHPATLAYYQGFYSSELAIRQNAFTLARTGSSPAQTLAIKLFDETRKNLLREGLTEEEI